MPALTFATMLQGGDRRSLGRSPEVAAVVLQHPHRAPELIACLGSDDPLIRMRAADAIEKASREKPTMLAPFRAALMRLFLAAEQQELRWHLAQMIPRLPLSDSERQTAIRRCREFLEDPSSIVRTMAMQALVDLARSDPRLFPETTTQIDRLTRTGTPAMRARGRKLLRSLNGQRKPKAAR